MNDNNIIIDQKHSLSLILFQLLQKVNAPISLYNDIRDFINIHGEQSSKVKSSNAIIKRDVLIRNMNSMVFGDYGVTKKKILLTLNYSTYIQSSNNIICYALKISNTRLIYLYLIFYLPS